MSELRDFGLALAERLPGWAFDEPHWTEYQHVARLVNQEIPGARMYLNGTRQRGRVEVSGSYPEGVYIRTEERVNITVSTTREIDAVAKDIQRRFLGAYLRVFQSAMERAYQTAQAQVRARDVADELAAISGCDATHGRDASEIWTRHGKIVIGVGSDEPHITMERLYSVPVEMAKEVARVMARY
jgi:hypothetical protein